jgi:hypothetical protein
MHVAGHDYNLLNSDEIGCIHRNALRILAEIGMEVQNQALLRDLAGFGLQVDLQTERVRFPAVVVERFLAEAEKADWSRLVPRVGGSAGVYHGRFHDPQSGDLLPWTEERMAYYFALARRMEHLSGASMLGSRVPAPAELEPLYERLYSWKYGAVEGGSIYLDELCPYVYEIYQARAAALGKPLAEVFRGTVYLIPPLKLGRHEAAQVAFFRDRGLHVGIGDMYALGANAPVNPGGGRCA